MSSVSALESILKEAMLRRKDMELMEMKPVFNGLRVITRDYRD